MIYGAAQLVQVFLWLNEWTDERMKVFQEVLADLKREEIISLVLAYDGR